MEPREGSSLGTDLASSGFAGLVQSPGVLAAPSSPRVSNQAAEEVWLERPAPRLQQERTEAGSRVFCKAVL